MMPIAPRVVGSCPVVLYSPIDARHRPTGSCKHVVAGVVEGPAAGLAICETKLDNGFYLFGCDADWNTRTDLWFASLEEAMDQGEAEYEGMRRTWLNHEPAWEPLVKSEENTVWDLFYEQFHFKPSVKAQDWPGIKEPTPSVTYDISHVFPELAAATAKESDLNMEVLTLFRQSVLPGERLYALDWQHPCYWFNPYGQFEFSEVYEGMIPVFPDGDYSIFLADDFRFGTFGHPWEQTICVFGETLLKLIERDRPRMLGRVIRRNATRM
jgi:hypothetical protein